ncbi:helix-turn-helix protein [Ciceribacter lividus]|uniref:Helix-turn-helix protein n=1 Tax=Ciceribacter lividus TaxID=1197950 RepID=A0A6I7HIH0_9HYPH|nr:AraC family transcriptional regulator [Ciceribacter lividus]RCW20554.1 helix-turn-helix protein [Ciceribacter lividus]
MNKNDILTGIFSALRLETRLYFEAAFPKAFSVALPRERQHIRFHLVLDGDAWIRAEDEEPQRLVEGDLAIVPHGSAQIVSDTPTRPPVDLAEVLARHPPEEGVLSTGGNPATRLLCGFCAFDEAIAHPLIAGLPALLVVRPAELRDEAAAAAALRLLAMEATNRREGMPAVVMRLVEIILIQTIRRLSSEDDQRIGFVAALADRRLSRALYAMHDAPERDWTVELLAKVAGMSRSRFATEFAEDVGRTPIEYLTAWRLAKARALLARSGLDIAEIAERCGYRSLPSFSQRFKATFGVSPARFRRESRGQA